MIFSNNKADIIVGIPSLNEADNIAFVAEQIDKGLQEFFPTRNGLIINVDNNSPDNTKRAFLKSKTKTEKKYISTPLGVLGKGNNFRNLFLEIKKHNPKACLVLDADLKSVEPEWIKKMITPILEDNYAYVLPVYSRNEYDGTITNHLVYPLLYGVLGFDLRQPIAGDFAFSPALSNFWLEQKWYQSTYQYGIDIFMTLNAILGNFKIAQVALGSKVHKPSAPKLGPMFTQVVDTLFGFILDNKNYWKKKINLVSPPLLFNGEKVDPQPLCIDYKTIKKTALAGWKEQQDFYRQIFPQDIYQKLQGFFENKEPDLDSKAWIEIIFYSLAAANHKERRIEVIESLKSLYFARTDSYIKKTLDLDYQACEAEIAQQAKYAFSQRNFLLDLFA